MTDPKPRIALVVDSEGWAFANIATQIQRHLGHLYEFDLISMTSLAEVEEARWRERGGKGPFIPGGGMALGPLLIQSQSYDLIHVFWREYLLLADKEPLRAYARSIGLEADEFSRRFVEPACVTTAVYDHLFSEPEALAQRGPMLNDLVADYYVSSAKLHRIYCQSPMLRPPSAIIEDGVDTEIFVPMNLQRLEAVPDREIIIGWVGNSGWSADIADFKGVNTILRPAVEQLAAEGMKLRLQLADRQTGFIPHDEMPRYYAGIDLYVCTSMCEGTPNPVLEAMACGVPVISTDVGVVPQVFGQAQAEFILAERSVDCLKAAIRRIAGDRANFMRLSQENLGSVTSWTWQRQTEKFAAFFAGVLRERGRSSVRC